MFFLYNFKTYTNNNVRAYTKYFESYQSRRNWLNCCVWSLILMRLYTINLKLQFCSYKKQHNKKVFKQKCLFSLTREKYSPPSHQQRDKVYKWTILFWKEIDYCEKKGYLYHVKKKRTWTVFFNLLLNSMK